MTAPLRIGNASGFYGDRQAAMREMLTDGPLDVLTGDYLAELTMLILARDRQRDPALGYARTFLRQLEDCLGLATDAGVKIVTNAGGLNPAGLAGAIRRLANRLGLIIRVAHVEGDDRLLRYAELPPGLIAENAYLGCWGIVECLRAGADIVVTGRVTDASLVVGPAAWHHGWARDDWDALAGASVAGHVLECGAQATGGNYSFFGELDVRRPGFPLAEIAADGSAVITKHPGTGGAVTTGTVTAQLLYEIGDVRYAGPDVVSRFDTIRLADDGADRVRISGVRGEPPPPTVKVGEVRLVGYRNSTTFVLTGLDIAAKADLVRHQVEAALDGARPQRLEWTLARTEHADADSEAGASALLHVTALDPDPRKVGRAFSRVPVELALASYPGFHVTAPPGEAQPYAEFTPTETDQLSIEQLAVLPDGRRLPVRPPTTREPIGTAPNTGPFQVDLGPTRRAPLGAVIGARSGDKGADANVGVWTRSAEAWSWLAGFLTAERVAELLPDPGVTRVTRAELPNLRAVNFVLHGILGAGGVASSLRFDPQGKALGEWLRSRVVDVPEVLL